MKTVRHRRARWVLKKHKHKRRRRHGKHWLPTYSMRPSGPLLPNPNPNGGGNPMVEGDWGPLHAERLLWRAGFGPKPGDVDRFTQLGLEAAVDRRWDEVDVLEADVAPDAHRSPPEVGSAATHLTTANDR
jgi:hypothetical protein